MGTFFKYLFYVIALLILSYIAMTLYDYYYQMEQPVEGETVVLSQK